MGHLDVVARAVLAHPIAARLALGSFGADGLEDVFHQGPGRHASAGHHGGAEARAFLAAGDAGSDEQETFALQVASAADAVGEMRVAAIDDEVARFEVGQKQLDEVIQGLAGLDHQHDFAGAL